MLFYTSNLILILIVFIYSKLKGATKRPEESTFGEKLVFLSLFFISGLRSVGADLKGYESYFNNLKYYSLRDAYYEKGYYLLNVFIKSFTDNSQYVVLLTSFITLYLITKTLKEFSVSYMFSVFLFVTLYFYYTSFNLVRQYLVVAILFYSVKYILNNNLRKFIITVLFASLFHVTALFMIPFYWVSKLKIKNTGYIILLLTTLALSRYTNLLISLVSKAFPKFSVYADYAISGSANTTILITTVTLLFSIFYKNKLQTINKNSLVFINMVFFSLLFAVLSRGNILFFRMSTYFYIFCILLIPICIQSLNKYLKTSLYCFVILGALFNHYYLLLNNIGGVLNYQYNLDLTINSDVIPHLPFVLLLIVGGYFLKKVGLFKQRIKIRIR